MFDNCEKTTLDLSDQSKDEVGLQHVEVDFL